MISKDLSNIEYDKIISTRFKELETYIGNTTIPDLVAFYISSGFNNSSIWEPSMEKIINTCLEYININIEITNELINKIINILDKKYKLKVLNLNPLNLEKK